MASFTSNLPARLNDFVGRENYINKIGHIFNNNQIIAITSFGGTGKSALAFEYAHRVSNKYITRVFNCDTKENFKTDLEDLLDLKDSTNKDINDLIKLFSKKLKESKENILFIYQNLDKYDDLKFLFMDELPSNLKILITTRNQINDDKISKIYLEPFNIGDAREYLNKSLNNRLTNAQIEKILEISKSTENEILPVKIQLIVSYFKTYQEKSIDEALNDIIGANYHNNKIEYSLFVNLQVENPDAFLVLQYCSFLDLDLIPIEILINLNDSNGKDNQDLFNNLKELENLSLIKRINKNDVKMHRLIQVEVHNYMENNIKYDKEIRNFSDILNDLIRCLEKLFENSNKNSTNRKKNEIYYHQSLKIVDFYKRYIQDNKNKSMHLVSLFKKIGLYQFYVLNDYKSSLKYIQEAIGINQSFFTSNNENLGELFNLIGTIYANLKDYTIALEYLNKSLEIYQNLFTSDHPDIANTLNNIGNIYRSLSEFSKSLDYYSRALEMRQRLNIYSDHPDLASSFNNIGAVYSTLNDYNKSIDYFLKSNDMYQRIYASDHPDIALTFNNIGISYFQSKDYKKSLEYYLKAFEIGKRIYPEDHPNVIDLLDKIALVYATIGEYDKALEYFLEVLEKRKKSSNDDTLLYDVMIKLAEIYEKKGDLKESIKYYDKLIEIEKSKKLPGNTKLTEIEKAQSIIKNRLKNPKGANNKIKDDRIIIDDPVNILKTIYDTQNEEEILKKRCVFF